MKSEIKNEISVSLLSVGAKVKYLSIDNYNTIRKMFFDIVKLQPYSRLFQDSYLKRFKKDYKQVFPGAKSIIAVAYPQPVTDVSFTLNDKIIKTILPPTYVYREREEKIKEILTGALSRRGLKLADCPLPEKFTAVVSGLGKYGKNNLCYVEGMGSFNSPLLYLSDLPSEKTEISEPLMLKYCNNCTRCRDNCPTGAIGPENFVIDPEKCETFYNENEFEFPGWVLPNWQNTIVGCMKCQEVCPANKGVLHNIVRGPDFSKLESDAIFNTGDFMDLPESAKAKITSLCMENYYEIIPRNLKILIDLS